MGDQLFRLSTAEGATLRFIGGKFYMVTVGTFPQGAMYLLFEFAASYWEISSTVRLNDAYSFSSCSSAGAQQPHSQGLLVAQGSQQ